MSPMTSTADPQDPNIVDVEAETSATSRAVDTWQDAKIGAVTAAKKVRDLDESFKLSERFADLKDRLTHARVKSDSLATAEFRRQFEMSMAYHSVNPAHIGHRLDELDDEWSAEQVMIALSSGLTVLGGVFSVTRSRLWTIVPLAASIMMLKGTFSRGEMPTQAFLRRAGFRTAEEIAQERYALKALRGDFNDVEQAEGHDDAGSNPAKLSHAVRS